MPHHWNGYPMTVRRVVTPNITKDDRNPDWQFRISRTRQQGRAEVGRLLAVAAKWWSKRDCPQMLICAPCHVVANLDKYPKRRRVIGPNELRRQAKIHNCYWQVAARYGITALEVVQSVRDCLSIGIDKTGELFVIEDSAK